MNEFIKQQIDEVCSNYKFESETKKDLLFRNEYGDGICINKETGQYWDQNNIAMSILGTQALFFPEKIGEKRNPENISEIEKAIKIKLMAYYYTRDKAVELTNFALLLITILTNDETKETGFCLNNLNEMLTENHEHGEFTEDYTGYINYLAKSFLVNEYIKNAEQQPAA